MKISRVQIENYRNLRNIDVSLEHIVAIIGENNSGKSNFLVRCHFHWLQMMLVAANAFLGMISMLRLRIIIMIFSKQIENLLLRGVIK